MRLFPTAVLLLSAGCMGDAAVPIVCSTDLPGTQYSVYLHGPDQNGYFYTIETSDGDCGLRALGVSSFDHPIIPKLEDLGDGVFRVVWGNGPESPFTTIDTVRKLIVKDSNESNSVNTPLQTPRYKRPEYVELRHRGVGQSHDEEGK